MSIRYIGSKARLVDQILAVIGAPSASRESRFVDAFCGTGAVAVGAAQLGWPVHLNDQLLSAVTLATARILSSKAVPFSCFGGYDAALAKLQAVSPRHGFIWQQYSPASATYGVERRYFAEKNASRIDAVRATINCWQATRAISGQESALLIADLMQAANRVANIAGTYGCFLREWTQQALEDLALTPRTLSEVDTPLTSSVGRAEELRVSADDLVYVDPPYTKRQYAAYYHILETIAYGDEPEVDGITGLRPWQSRASDFCYKRRALIAFERLINHWPARRIMISYSSEGHVPIDPLMAMLRRHGDVELHAVADIGRYRPNTVAVENGSKVREYLIDVRR